MFVINIDHGREASMDLSLGLVGVLGCSWDLVLGGIV